MWRFEPAGGIEHRAELALVLGETVAAKAAVAVFGFEPAEAGPVRGAGYAFSPGLNADYAYLPASKAGTLIVIPVTFETKLTALTLRLLSWPGKQEFGADRFRGSLITVFSDDEAIAITRPGRWVA